MSTESDRQLSSSHHADGSKEDGQDAANGRVGPLGSPCETSLRSKSQSGRTAVLSRLADVDPEPVEFLWEPFLPKGKVSLLEGNPDAGKTTIALAIAAAVTRGGPLPGDSSDRAARKVLYFTAEDGIADTLRPRFDRLQGDPEKFFVYTHWTNHADESSPVLAISDLDVLRSACRIEPALVVFDPLLAYFGTGVDSSSATHTRPLLTALATVAAETGACVLGIRHLRKSDADRAIYRGLGSVDIAASVRSMLMVGDDPTDASRRVLAHSKANLSRKGASRGFSVSDQGIFAWHGESTLSADDLVGPRPADQVASQLDAAKAFLIEFLADGPVESAALESEAQHRGHSVRTIKRARRELGVRSERQRNAWVVWLPSEARRPTADTAGAGTVDLDKKDA